MVIVEIQKNKLPKNWEYRKLGDKEITYKITSGGTPNRGKKEYWENGTIPWLKSGELEDNFIFDTEEKITDEGFKNSSAKYFEPNTVLIALYGATVGKTGLLKIRTTTNQAICGIEPDINKLKPKFLFYFLQSIREQLISKCYGGAQPNISQNIIKNLDIPLPDIIEQERIVKKLDMFLRNYNEFKQEMQKVKEKHEMISQNTIASIIDNFKTNKRKKFSEVATVNGRIGWKGLKRSEYTNEGPLFLAVKNIGKYDIDFTDTYHLSKERYEESPEIILKEKDILLTKDGTIGHVGFIKEIPSKATVNSSIVIIRPKKRNELLPKFLYRYFQSTKFQAMVSHKKTGTCVPHLFQKDIKNFQLEIPDVNEQNIFINKIDQIEKHLISIDKYQKTIDEQLEQLPKSVLKKAFTGRLT